VKIGKYSVSVSTNHTSESACTWVHACETFRRSKVGDFDNSAVRVDENVVTLDISVYNLVVVLATEHKQSLSGLLMTLSNSIANID